MQASCVATKVIHYIMSIPLLLAAVQPNQTIFIISICSGSRPVWVALCLFKEIKSAAI